MDITSLVYIMFVAVCLVIYWVMPSKRQWYVLLVASLLFYFLNSKAYTFVYLLTSVLTVWGATVYFENCCNDKKRKIVLIITLLINIGLLAVLKYTNLAINTFNLILKEDNAIKPVTWIASMGISFYTLQIVAYLLDVYWKVTAVEHNPFKLLLFTSYFPLMISGPISEYEQLGYQFYEEHRFSYEKVTKGMKRIAWGMIKKLAISNRMAIVVNFLWNDVNTFNGLWIWFAVFLYVIQLYTDFSGCMDIVLGTSECFGIKLVENFKSPLFSKNIQEFWQRWHISLGQWLKNYIMNPLLKSELFLSMGNRAKKIWGKKKGKKVPVYCAMLALWLAMGLWHGSSWKYIIGEGLWFWFVIVVGQLLEEQLIMIKDKLKIRDGVIWNTFQVIRTNFIFIVGMLFFRASSFLDSLMRIRQSFVLEGTKDTIGVAINEMIALLENRGISILVIALIALIIYDAILYKGIDLFDRLKSLKWIFRWMIYIIMIVIILMSYDVGAQEFAYAQF